MTPLIIAQHRDIIVDLDNDLRGPISGEIPVVGDIFSYKINLSINPEDFGGDIINLTVKIYDPNGKVINDEERNFAIDSRNFVHNLIPFLNENKTEVRIYSFEKQGEYIVELCAPEDKNIRFNKYYNLSGEDLYYYYPDCFKEYYSAMPKWQYDIWESQQNYNNSLNSYTLILVILTSFLFLASLVEIISEEKRIKGFGKLMQTLFVLSLMIFATFVLWTVFFGSKSFYNHPIIKATVFVFWGIYLISTSLAIRKIFSKKKK